MQFIYDILSHKVYFSLLLYFFHIFAHSVQGHITRKAHKAKVGSKKTSTESKSSKMNATIDAVDDLSRRVFKTLKRKKDTFFTVLLNPPIPLPFHSSYTSDPDNLISCDIMDGHDKYLAMARKNHWEFS